MNRHSCAAQTCGYAVVHHAEPMDSNLFSCSLDVLQLVLGLDADVLNLADRLINVRYFSLLSCLDALGCYLPFVHRLALVSAELQLLDTKTSHTKHAAWYTT